MYIHINHFHQFHTSTNFTMDSCYSSMLYMYKSCLANIIIVPAKRPSFAILANSSAY